MIRSQFVCSAFVVAFGLSGTALAHISVISGPAFANTTQEITFGVGHGCAGADTYSVRVDIPADVASVRTGAQDLGKASVETSPEGRITAVTWKKSDADILAEDTAFYRLTLRIKVPNSPFTTLAFPTHQVCKGIDGGVSMVDWVSESALLPDGGAAEPAPSLVILPARRPGWNKFTAPLELTALAPFFGDALIVWQGARAYSANSATAEVIAMTQGVSPLASLLAGEEIWVKY